jgi:Protein of unknown function (DUF3551)
MKLLLSALAVIAASAAPGAPAHAQNYPWCALYNGGGAGGGTNCGFVSFAQCMATARGLGSFCYMNTQYVPPPGPHQQRRYPY